MKKQIVFVLTELYGNDSDTEVNVLGVYTTKTKAKEMLEEKKTEGVGVIRASLLR